MRRGDVLGRRMVLAVAALAIGFLGLVAALEAGLRLREWWRESQARRGEAGTDDAFWAVYDEDLVYRLRPGHGKSNRQGTLGPSLDLESNRFRLLVLGDSLGYYGDTDDGTYVELLADQLRSDRRLAPIDVINTSTPGYTNYQELVYLRKYGLAFEPDLVGVAFVLNDLHRFLHGFRIEDGKITGTGFGFQPEVEAQVPNLLLRLIRRSYAALWLKNRLSILGRLAEMAARGAYSFEYRPDFARAWDPAAWPAIERQLSAMKELAAAHDFRLFVYLFPYAPQLRSDYLERDRGYVLYPQRRLAEICAEQELDYLDLTPVLSRTDLFQRDEVHLTDEGRALAAQALHRFLVSERLVPLVEAGALAAPSAEPTTHASLVSPSYFSRAEAADRRLVQADRPVGVFARHSLRDRAATAPASR